MHLRAHTSRVLFLLLFGFILTSAAQAQSPAERTTAPSKEKVSNPDGDAIKAPASQDIKQTGDKAISDQKEQGSSEAGTRPVEEKATTHEGPVYPSLAPTDDDPAPPAGTTPN
jgi:hypothetical protein